MPTTYAHYRFGCDALQLLEGQPLAETIKKERAMFDWGVHGPDLCFYYHPARSNPVFRAGRYYHQMTGHRFFRQQADLLRKYVGQPDVSAPYIAYLLGVLCHYTLDRECHPYIAVKEQEGASHDAIEAHFDRLLIKKDGFTPNTFRPTGHLHPSERSAAIISEFYPEISSSEFLEAERGMLRILGMLSSPALPRTFFRCVASFRGADDMFMPLRDDHRYDETNTTLLDLYQSALGHYPELLSQLVRFIRSHEALGPEFDPTFSV